MLDIKFITENPSIVKDTLKKRFKSDKIWLVDELIRDYNTQNSIKRDLDHLRSKRNTISKEINALKKAKKDASIKLKQASKIPDTLKELEEDIQLIKEEINKKLIQIPNILHKDVPKGKDETKNKEIKKSGRIKKFTFKIKNHEDLAEELNIANFEAGRLTAGQGFNYLTGDLAKLDYALQKYGIDFITKKGFELVIPPLMLNKKTLAGAINLTDFEDVIYKIEGEDLHLIATAEHPLVSMHSKKIINKKDLPLKFCAVTPCFRKEIGSHGVDTKGLFRMHQFNKVEQVILTTKENSFKILEEMQKITEQFFKSLEIPFRVIEICSGDLGDKFSRQYDIEAWFPRQNKYAEVTSAGNCTDYQARKLNIKYTDGNEKSFVHILNNTMVATSRAMVAILENFQQKNGTIKIPKVLHKYTGFKEIKSKK
jgi:seryl-tRNA synthetase